MLSTLKKHSKLVIITCAVLIIGLTLVVLLNLPNTRSYFKSAISSALAHLSSRTSEPFPTIETVGLSTEQIAIVKLSSQEYAKKPVSFDQNVHIYTEGVNEPWCADYVSWIYKKAGTPLSNPNSGSWRIPGVLTLQQYFKSTNRYKSVGAYTPKTGDVAMYVGNKTLDGRSRQHTNIVLKVENNSMTTIGGNERGRLRVSSQPYNTDENSLVGFGIL